MPCVHPLKKMAVAGCALLCFACTSTKETSPPTPAAHASEPTGSVEERTYLHLMAEHQTNGVHLTQDAQRQASAPEVKQLADNFLSKENEALNQLEGLGATAPDGRENPDQEKRKQTSSPSGPAATENLVGRVGPGVVAEGPGSYDQRWLKTFGDYNEKGLQLAREFAPKLSNKSLKVWNDNLIKREESQLAEVKRLKVP